jgi:uncharacterized protein (TIGR00369 family)
VTLVKEDGRCFVCGPVNPIGLKLAFQIDVVGQSASARVRVPANFQGWSGIVHGGIIASLLDEVCMHACRTTGDQMVTAELTVRYREPLPVETDVVISGKVCGIQRRLLLAQGRIERDGRLLAEADAKVIRIK